MKRISIVIFILAEMLLAMVGGAMFVVGLTSASLFFSGMALLVHIMDTVYRDVTYANEV